MSIATREPYMHLGCAVAALKTIYDERLYDPARVADIRNIYICCDNLMDRIPRSQEDVNWFLRVIQAFEPKLARLSAATTRYKTLLWYAYFHMDATISKMKNSPLKPEFEKLQSFIEGLIKFTIGKVDQPGVLEYDVAKTLIKKYMLTMGTTS